MKTGSNGTESKPDSSQEDGSSGYDIEAAEEVGKEIEAKGGLEGSDEEPELDEYGYEKVKEAPANDEGDDVSEKKTEVVEDDTPIEKPSTGYGDDEPADETPAAPVVEKTEAEKTEEEKRKGEIAEALKEIGDNFDKEKISNFALANGFSKEQVAAYAKFAKEDAAAAAQKVKEQVAAQRKSWHKELKEDKEFAGPDGKDFRKNVDRAEKVLQKYMPETKKMLDDKKSMLPPYIMRDLARLSKSLNPTTKLVKGDIVVKKDSAATTDWEDFYATE